MNNEVKNNNKEVNNNKGETKMNKDYIVCHSLSNAATNNFNAGENGDPKEIMFGDKSRYRVSSQASKRAVRIALRKDLETSMGSINTVSSNLIREILKDNQDITKGTLESLCKAYGFKPKTALRLSPKEIDIFKDLAVHIDITKDMTLDEAKKILKETVTLEDAVDIVLCGRMNASDPSKNVDGVTYVSHSFTTGSIPRGEDYDMFVAIDDLTETVGAAHLNERRFASGTYYNSFCIDVKAFMNHPSLIEISEGDKKNIIRRFVEALFLVKPSGKRNSMFATTYPSCMVIVKTSGQPVTCADAFEKPCKTYDESYKALKCQLEYNERIDKNKTSISEFSKETENNFEDFINDVV